MLFGEPRLISVSTSKSYLFAVLTLVKPKAVRLGFITICSIMVFWTGRIIGMSSDAATITLDLARLDCEGQRCLKFFILVLVLFFVEHSLTGSSKRD